METGISACVAPHSLSVVYFSPLSLSNGKGKAFGTIVKQIAVET